jgi:hypothetical protein
MIAALCELEAKRYKASDPALVGAFRRQAHLRTRAIQRWLFEIQPMRSIKNSFAEHHGFDSCRKPGKDIDFVIALLGLAATWADDSIPEKPCPSEIGGYVFEIFPAFHKVFASCQDAYVELDTRADPYYNATGLGRFLVKAGTAQKRY